MAKTDLPKTHRGGRREGAGRPRKNKAILYARMNPEAIEAIKAQAEASGLTVGEYIEAQILKKKKKPKTKSLR